MSGESNSSTNWRTGDAFDESEMLSSRSRPPDVYVRRDLLAEIYAAKKARRDRKVDVCLQVGIAVSTFAAIWLVGGTTEYARWGHVVGLISQPFYIAASWRARQWGMFIVAIALCGLWWRGIVNNFF